MSFSSFFECTKIYTLCADELLWDTVPVFYFSEFLLFQHAANSHFSSLPSLAALVFPQVHVVSRAGARLGDSAMLLFRVRRKTDWACRCVVQGLVCRCCERVRPAMPTVAHVRICEDSASVCLEMLRSEQTAQSCTAECGAGVAQQAIFTVGCRARSGYVSLLAHSADCNSGRKARRNRETKKYQMSNFT